MLSIARSLYNSPAKRLFHALPRPLKRAAQRLAGRLQGSGMGFGEIPRVYPTLKCNLACPYCSDGLGYDKSDMGFEPLAPERWIDILNQLPGNAVIFTGGEPTLYEGLPDVINGVDKEDVRVYTNLAFNVPAFLDRLAKPVTFFTSFHPNSPAMDLERSLDKLRQLMAHPMCRGVSSHHLIRDPSNGTPGQFAEWKNRFKEIGVKLLLYDNQFETNAVGPEACAFGETETVDCAVDRLFLGPDGQRYICVGKMIRRKADGIIPIKSALPRMICHDFGMCSPCDEVATIRPAPPKARRGRLSLFIVALFAAYHLAVAALVSNTAPYPSDFDEHQHVSFVFNLLEDPRIFADASLMSEVDENDLTRFDGPGLYLKHPTFYYHLMGLFANPSGLSLAANVARLRTVNVVLSFLAIAVFLIAGRRLFEDDPRKLFLFAAVLVLTPTAAVLGGMINNDNMALLGAAIAFLGLVRYLEEGEGGTTALLIGSGFAVGALSKLSAGLLVGLMIAIIHLYRRRELFQAEGRKVRHLAIIIAFTAIGMAPYLYNLYIHGSPIPNSPHPGVFGDIIGWFEFLKWFIYVVGYTWSFFNFDAADMATPIMLTGLSIFGAWSTLGKDRSEAQRLAGRLALAGLVSVLVVLVINYGFNYSGHLETGYMKGMHFRYYLPALGAVAAGATLGVFALPHPWARRLAGGVLVGLQLYGHTYPILAAIVEAAV